MAENLVGKRVKPKFPHDGYLYVFDKRSKIDPLLLLGRCELKKRM